MRCTVDLDKPSEFEALKTYYNMLHLFQQTPDVRLSSGRRGYHLIVRGLPITLDTCLNLRRLLGDDPLRIYFDSLVRLFKPKNVLFRPAERYGQSPPPFLRFDDTLVQPQRVRRRLKWMRKLGKA